MDFGNINESRLIQDLMLVDDSFSESEDNLFMNSEWMKAKCIDEIVEETKKRIALVAGMWVVFLPLMGILDYIYLKEYFFFFFLSKVATSLTLFGIIRFAKTRSRLDELTLLGIITFVLTGAVISITAHKVGMNVTSYYAGLNLVILSLIAMPWSSKEASLVGIMIYSFYLMPLFQLYQDRDVSVIITNNFFLVNTLVFTIIIVNNNYKTKIKGLHDSVKIHSYNEKLKDVSIRDYLTGTFNKRYFEELLQIEMRRSKRYSRPLCLVLVDIDFFKQINDKQGHGVGDKILKLFGDILITSVRNTDYPARVGGDEFAIIFTEASLGDILPILENIRTRMKYETSYINSVNLGVTLSIGVASMDDTTVTIESLFNKADISLYQAKQNGRDRIDTGNYSLIQDPDQLYGQIK